MKKILITGGHGDWAKWFQEHCSDQFDFYCPNKQELNVGDIESVRQYFEGKMFDIVINNAGTIHPQRVLDSDEKLWIRDIEVNLIGVYLVTKAALGRNSETMVINISSAAGFSAYPDWSSYCASKAAVNTLTKSLANDGFKVYAVCPGGFDSKFRDYFNLDNSNLMSLEKVSEYVLDILSGKYTPGDLIFFRNDDVKIY